MYTTEDIQYLRNSRAQIFGRFLCMVKPIIRSSALALAAETITDFDCMTSFHTVAHRAKLNVPPGPTAHNQIRPDGFKRKTRFAAVAIGHIRSSDP